MTGGSGVPHVHGARGTRGSGFVPGFGLSVNSPLRAVCPKCSAAAGHPCAKVDRYGMTSFKTRPHRERTAAARAARA